MQADQAEIGMRVRFRWLRKEDAQLYPYIEGKVGEIEIVSIDLWDARVVFEPPLMRHREIVRHQMCAFCFLTPVKLTPEEEIAHQQKIEQARDLQRREEFAAKYL